MRTLLTLLLIFMVGFVGTIQANENPNLKVKTELKAISLEDEFFKNNWEVVIPYFIEENAKYKAIYDHELGLSCTIIVNSKTKSVKMRVGNKFQMDVTDLKFIIRNNLLYFSSDELGGGVMEIKKVKGKLICMPMNDGVKIGDEYDMKVYSGKVK